LLGFLKLNQGLSKATEVLLSGGSAGGLSAFLHADYVRSHFGPEVKFGVAPVSGFFLMHDNAQGVDEYPARMQYVYNMMNSSGGVNQQCRAAQAPGDAWRCIFAHYSYAHTQVPVFPLQSSVDKWQMGSIFAIEKAGNPDCTRVTALIDGSEHQLVKCTESQRHAVAQYQRDFLSDLQASAAFDRAGNGGYIESCIEHVAGQTSAYNTYRSPASDLTMQQALTAWWDSIRVQGASGQALADAMHVAHQW
jgi:O-palmitoleoyl-L-serine hydrolase